ncbi:nucleotidyltransferase family protein [Polycladidibacter stylochi]|uniref:nucleotidyltransferase family protein n=1 Tax=Polycladidibacter stylochi TaxID=1807766 RepID=UPI000AF8EC91|nr:nucleotidyltransferase family protein [Pseudovibrio stylochi]
MQNLNGPNAYEVGNLPRLALLLLAAGRSKRMQGQNKMLLPIHREPMVKRCAERLLSSGLGPLYVVTGHESEKVENALSSLELQRVYNENYLVGQDNSISCGFEYLNALDTRKYDGVLLAKCDMPSLGIHQYRLIAEAYLKAKGQKLIVPVHQGVSAYPLVVPVHLIGAVANGELKLRKLVKYGSPPQYEAQIKYIDVSDPVFTEDIDSPEDYERATAWHSQR